ncbi:ABC transporter ATP-binding protein [Amycolatopsis sp.]|uniref:ABC transporter ATP-binding protein n=1 Tax=Amycolatopsis sp. TaxID=37632 RepID=UPI002CF3A79C|nr:ABC transporter ATP-binding protein [Amycolatopsis sp.]HVV09318.1 ABC transporter ATP-binding protein [Amycolatopsis sp.]
MLRVEGLRKRYGAQHALDGFDLTVEPGEIAGLIGHNGAGKTTFVEVVTGLVRPDAGQVLVGGRPAARPVRRKIGYAPQETALYPSLTVRENMRLFGALAGLRKAREARIEGLARELHLSDCLDKPTGLLSGGQRRRAQAATAMIGAPPLLLLDEPTAGADPQTRAALLDAVRSRADAGAAVVYTTHYLPELVDLDATLAVARAGRIVARGTRDELTRDLPGELRVAFDETRELPAPLRERARTVDGEIRITTADAPSDLGALLAAGLMPVAVDVRRPDLDDLYRSLETVDA